MNLVLNSYGSSLQKKDGLFFVKSGDIKQQIHPKEIKTILISKSARISSDAVLLAIEHEIDILFVDGKGDPKGRIWSVQYGSIASIRKAQLEFLYSGQSLDWIKNLLFKKINGQIGFLLALQTQSSEKTNKILARAINSMEDHKNKIRGIQGNHISDVAPTLRGWEGAANRHYFRALSETLPDPFKFSKRSQHPAYDKFNCMLNYGYGILYGKIEGSLIKAGIDPYVGIFHRDDYNRPALVYDIIENYRVWVDYVVVRLCSENTIPDECFEIKKDIYWLSSLGRRIIIQSVHDFLAEVIDIKGIERSRSTHIQLNAHRLAKTFQKQ